MTYEEKIAQFSGYDVIIRTDVDLRNADMLNSMHTVANRLRMILSAVELHADYEDLLAIKDILIRITRIINDWQADDCNKQAKLQSEIDGDVKEEDCPFKGVMLMIKITDIAPFMCDGDYVAMQPNGDWYVYGSEPELKKDCWVAHSNTLCCISDAFDIAPADDWTQSLIKVGGNDD